MAFQHSNAPSHSTYGVQHANVRQTRNFTVVSNDLIRHPATPTTRPVGSSPRRSWRSSAGSIRACSSAPGTSNASRAASRPGWSAGPTHHAVTSALAANLPDRPRNPAGLIAHRLATQLPPLLAPIRGGPAFVPPDPFQTCEKCDRAFRAPTPGTCKGCTPT
ncbi:hypothetical protein [Streptomyces sp. NRRL S-244]|uniref:hypothetical protein n=1 Tax=Streptomyces sp. NRRL S-244 TaxID=1463897 RepID=UPI00131A5A03|nr:hypothetical protein [Streptomyces sp. NRRL S-244]